MDQLPELNDEVLHYILEEQINSYSMNEAQLYGEGNIYIRGTDPNMASTSSFTHPDQVELFSDSESLTSSGSAVPSPAMFNAAEQQFGFLIPDDELKILTVKELNKRLKGSPKEDVQMVKKRRRTLKNRGYAHSCRIKRIEEKSNLQRSKAELKDEIASLEREVTVAREERDTIRSKYDTLICHLMKIQSQRMKR